MFHILIKKSYFTLIIFMLKKETIDNHVFNLRRVSELKFGTVGHKYYSKNKQKAKFFLERNY